MRIENENTQDGIWDQLPGRHPVHSDRRSALEVFSGKRILITGAAGCIGAALAQAIATSAPEQLILLDASEHGLYQLESSLPRPTRSKAPVTVLGNVGDQSLLATLFEQHSPHIVFHAAAFKHVPIMERHPFTAIANNAIATYHLTQAAATHGCEQMVLVSTDKAADPVSIMGASKRIAELSLLASPHSLTRMKAIRLGNVLGSPGSIVPLFLHQIASAGPITVTHPEVRRYFMTVEEAVTALLRITAPKYGNGIFVPQLGEPIRVLDLAKHLIAATTDPLLPPSQIVFTALRHGDKLEEVLISKREAWADNPEPAHEAASLRSVISPCLLPQAFAAAIDDLNLSLQTRNLNRMIDIVLRLIPDYQASSLIAAQLHPSQPTALGVHA